MNGSAVPPRPAVITIVCLDHEKPHIVARYSDHMDQFPSHPLVLDDVVRDPVLGWRELEAWSAAGRRQARSVRRSPNTDGWDGDSFAEALSQRIDPALARPMQTFVTFAAGGKHIHANACSRCRQNVPIPNDRMQVLLDKFADAGISEVTLPMLADADTRRADRATQ